VDKAQKILFRRSHKLVLSAGGQTERNEYVASLNKNLQAVGYTLAPELISILKSWSPEELLDLSENIFPILLKEVGGHVVYKPMYPNFPEQVMEIEEAELYLNAIVHYYGDAIGERILPKYSKQKRNALQQQGNFFLITLAEENAPRELCSQLMLSNTSISKADVQDLKALMGHFRDDLKYLVPETIPFKEVKAVVCERLIYLHPEPESVLLDHLKTATDILRFAIELSDGDVSLSSPTKFLSMPRRTRRIFLALIESCFSPVEDMFRNKEAWKRLGERLHPGEYRKRFPKAYKAFTLIRNEKSVETFNSKLEAFFREKNFTAAAKLLSARPGELARRLDFLIRTAGNPNEISTIFEEVASKVATPLLLQVSTHFRERSQDQTPKIMEDVPSSEKLSFFERALGVMTKPSRPLDPLSPMRTVFPKGQLGKLMRIPNALKRIDSEAAKNIASIANAALVSRFSELVPLGKVYLDPSLQNFNIPFASRSASKSLKTLARGSRISLPDAPTIRFFLWWKEGIVDGVATGRVDVDLSATFYSENWKYLDHVSYTNLKTTKFGACHSGDLTSAPNGAAEFIDIDIRRARSRGARYLITSVLSFSNQSFCDLPECYTGWMSRKKNNSGEIFEPATVQNKIDLASNTRVSIPTVIDLQEGTLYWADLALRSRPAIANNIEANKLGLVHYGYAVTNTIRPSLFNLFELHAQGRGESVDSKEDADIIFSIEEGVTPYCFDKIVSEFLG